MATPTAGPRSFLDARFACLSCHKVGEQGGAVGPGSPTSAARLEPEEIVESVLWPKRKVKEVTRRSRGDGRAARPGLQAGETDASLAPRGADRREAQVRSPSRDRGGHDDRHADARRACRRDDRRRAPRPGPVPARPGPQAGTGHADDLVAPARPTSPADFAYDRAPLRPERWPQLAAPGEPRPHLRLLRQGGRVLPQPAIAHARLLPPFPGLDGGKLATGATRTRTSGTTAGTR